MKLNDLILVSVDDHITEPPTVFENQLPADLLELAPRVIRTDDGSDVWLYEGVEIPNIGLNAVKGRVKEEYGLDPTAFDEMRKGCWDVHARIDDMNANGVLGSLGFPTFVQFCGQTFARSKDKDLALRFLQAYNNWHIDEWCGAYPGRFIPLALPVLWDVELLVDEVKRVAEKGCHAVTFSENPAKLGFPSLHSHYWDPFWQVCSDLGTVPCMHIGSSSQLVVTADDAPFDVMATLQPVNVVQTAADLVWSHVLRDFPNLRIALSEGGIGWLPWFLDKCDQVYRKHGWTGQDYQGRQPSEVFGEQVITCFIEDVPGLENLHRLNVDNVTWECDYPHGDSEWPRSPESLLAGVQAADVSDEIIDKITHENTMRLFQYDPFSARARDKCTVGALRSEATHVDTEPRSMVKRAMSGETSAKAHADLWEPTAR